jgi:molybdate transport system substrate-binding protein
MASVDDCKIAFHTKQKSMITARRAGRAAGQRLLQCMTLSAALLAVAGVARGEGAEGLKVLTAGAIKPVVGAVAAAYGKESGGVVSVQNDTAGALVKRLEAGEACDVAILPPAALDALAGKGVTDKGSAHPIARIGVGVAVAAGAPRPDVSTVAAFKAAVLAAPSVAYLDPAAGGSSGVYLTGLFKQLGISEQVAPKAVLVQGGLVAQKLVDGSAALAIHQISELLAVPGATLVGPLPAEIQNYTYYAAAVCAKSNSKKAAGAFIDQLHTPAADALIKSKGMEPAQ